MYFSQFFRILGFSRNLLGLVLKLLLSSMLLSGCFSHGKTQPTKTPTKAEAQPPIKVEVTQAFFVAETLHVTIQVFAKTDLETKLLLVRLIGLNQGNIIHSISERASDVAGDERLEEGESILFRLKIPAAELTEYQVQVAWGDESRQKEPKSPGSSAANSKAPEVNARSEEPLHIIGHELEEIGDTTCSNPPCDKHYAIRAELLNKGRGEISNIKLGVGIYFAPAGQVPQRKKNKEPLSEGEELLDLGELRLSPGEQKKMKIAVERGVPQVPGGSFLPYARIIEYQESGR